MKDVLKRLDVPLLISTIIFIILGLVMIFSASSITAIEKYNLPEYHFFLKELIVVIVGAIVSFIFLFIDTRRYNFISYILIIVMIIVLISLKTYGSITNSAKSWFKFMGFSVQPSEFCKTAIVLFLACAYGNRKKFKNKFDILLPLVACVFIFGLVAIEPDLGTACIIALMSMAIFFTLPIEKNMFYSGIKLLTLLVITGGIFFLSTDTQFLTETQKQRFTFKNPCQRMQEATGYQVCNGYIAIHNGGLFGMGLGKSKQKNLYLPEAYTDFIFPIVVEEIGLVGGIAILILYMFVLYRILAIARNARNLRGSIIAFGTFAYILIHICINLGGALSLIPLTGVPLPFLSYGGSFMLNLLLLLTLTQRVAIESKYKKEGR
jgi:cell division protein FtsW